MTPPTSSTSHPESLVLDQETASVASQPPSHSTEVPSSTNGDGNIDEEMLSPISKPVPPNFGVKEDMPPGATTLLREIWYYGAASKELKPGKNNTIVRTICGEMVLLGRDADGNAFAVSNICPHQGMPLDAGNFNGREVACPFHGWRFNTDGQCTTIPALLPEQQPMCSKFKINTYPVQEAMGNIWVYIGEKRENLPDIPPVPGIEPDQFYDTVQNRLSFPVNVDIGMVGLMDPAHIPFVHTSWWYSSPKRIHEKKKTFEPYLTGYRMIRHKPSKNATVFKWFGGGLETEIALVLPSVRIETISHKGKTLFCFLTALSPIDEQNTEMINTVYWTHPLASLLKPFMPLIAHTFLMQDVRIAERQAAILRNPPKNMPHLVMNIPDSGYPVQWYQMAKRAWAKAVETDTEYKNPIQARILRWRT